MSTVYINGVYFDSPRYLPVPGFFKAFLSNGQAFTTVDTKWGEKTVVLSQNRKYTAGLILSDTKEGASITKRVDGGRLILEVHETTDGSGAATTRQAFTFFVLKANGKGVFTQYKGSGGCGLFTAAFKTEFNEYLKNERAKLSTEQLSNIPARDRNRRTFEVSYLTPQANFEEMLDRFASISAAKITPVNLSIEMGTFRGLLSSNTIEMNFARNKRSLVEKIRKKLLEFIQRMNVQTGTVYGKDTDGVDVEAEIDPSKLCLTKVPFKEVAKTANFGSTDLFQAPIVKLLIRNIEYPDHALLFSDSLQGDEDG